MRRVPATRRTRSGWSLKEDCESTKKCPWDCLRRLLKRLDIKDYRRTVPPNCCRRHLRHHPRQARCREGLTAMTGLQIRKARSSSTRDKSRTVGIERCEQHPFESQSKLHLQSTVHFQNIAPATSQVQHYHTDSTTDGLHTVTTARARETSACAHQRWTSDRRSVAEVEPSLDRARSS